MTAQELYAAMCLFAQENGLRRYGEGSGWWWGEKLQSEMRLGEAVEVLISSELDMRNAVPGEVREYWG